MGICAVRQSATDAVLAHRQAAALVLPQRGLSPAPTPALPLKLAPALTPLRRKDHIQRPRPQHSPRRSLSISHLCVARPLLVRPLSRAPMALQMMVQTTAR